MRRQVSRRSLLLGGGALFWVPLQAKTIQADPQLHGKTVEWFQLTESPRQVQSLIGAPALVADFGAGFQSWQYQLGQIDHHEFSHQFVFRKSTGGLISVARNYEPERDVDALFPVSETRTCTAPGTPGYGLRLRPLKGNRLLLAMGSPRPHQPTGQLVLISVAEIENFYPWLMNQVGFPVPHNSREFWNHCLFRSS